jgi:hypothetical protein
LNGGRIDNRENGCSIGTDTNLISGTDTYILLEYLYTVEELGRETSETRAYIIAFANAED